MYTINTPNMYRTDDVCTVGRNRRRWSTTARNCIGQAPVHANVIWLQAKISCPAGGLGIMLVPGQRCDICGHRGAWRGAISGVGDAGVVYVTVRWIVLLRVQPDSGADADLLARRSASGLPGLSPS